MYPKLINFELFYLNGEHTQEDLENKKLQLIFEEIKQSGATEIVGLLLTDGFIYTKNDNFLKSMRKIKEYASQHSIEKITLLTGMCEDSGNFLKNNGINFDIEFFNFTHWMVAKGYENRPASPKWNSTANKFLFLGGVPSRHNRITLLSKLYDAELLSRAEWSFFPPWTAQDQEWCRQALSHYTNEEYETFLNFSNRTIDDAYNNAKDYSRLSGLELKKNNTYNETYLSNVGYIDPNIFSNTVLSIVSEGNAYPPADNFRFLTEKIWRPIANRHPFILAGYQEQVEFAKSLGLKTFEQYFLVPDYYKIDNEFERLDCIVQNVQHFMSTFNNRAAEINTDVEHNHQLFCKIFDYSNRQIAKYSVEDREQFFNHRGWAHLIRIPDVN